MTTSSNKQNDDSQQKKGNDFVNNSVITDVNTQRKFVESTTVGQKNLKLNKTLEADVVWQHLQRNRMMMSMIASQIPIPMYVLSHHLQ